MLSNTQIEDVAESARYVTFESTVSGKEYLNTTKNFSGQNVRQFIAHNTILYGIFLYAYILFSIIIDTYLTLLMRHLTLLCLLICCHFALSSNQVKSSLFV